jgi:imidazolonepropionase-like amidohydrolase
LSDKKVFLNANIFNGTEISSGNLMIEDSIIKGVYDQKSEYDVEVFDCQGKTIIPGLIDLHVHTTMLTDDEVKKGVNVRTISNSVLRGEKNIQEALKYGVTTIRDCGSKHMGIFALRDKIKEGLIIGPEMFLSGCALRSTGGHADRVSITADGTVQIIKEIRKQIKEGADWIKLMLTGGTSTPGENITDVQYSLEEIKAATGEAHRKGVKVCAHISNLKGAELAVEAGIDCIQHGIELSNELIDKMIERDISLVPCTYLTNREANDNDLPSYIKEKAKEIRDRQLESFFNAYKKGVRCGVGTDADGLYHPFGKSMIWELEWLVKNGLTPFEALKMVTSSNADILKANNIGYIKAGYLADLVIISGNPLRDISALKNIDFVVKRGRINE